MRAIHWLIYPVILAMLAGCTPTSVKPIATLPTTARTVVIVPALPRYLFVATQGVTVFGNHVETPSDKGWNLDALVYHSAKAVLPPRFLVSDFIPLAQIIDTQSRLDAAIDDDVVVDDLKKVTKPSSRPDLYIVFCVSDRSHPYVNSPVFGFMEDIGVSKMLAPLGLNEEPVVHAYLEMSVIDGRSMKLISDTPILMPPGSNRTVGLLGGDDPYPEIGLPRFKWHDHWSNMTPGTTGGNQTGYRASAENRRDLHRTEVVDTHRPASAGDNRSFAT